MIHVVTAHHGAAAWIPIQLGYLKRNIAEPFHVHTCCTGGLRSTAELESMGTVYPWDSIKAWGTSRPNPGCSHDHAIKLDYMAEQVCTKGNDDDLVMFIDSDTLVLPEVMDTTRAYLDRFQLVAARRSERGCCLAHPLFCVTTVRVWRDLPGTWMPGPYKAQWNTPDRRIVDDTGSRLLQRMDGAKTTWHDFTRSNKVELTKTGHFGIYGDIVYHHQAGSRPTAWTKRVNRPAKLIGAQVFKLAQTHVDFYKLFTEGKYRDQIKGVK